jgi:hypothetical protein
MNLDDLMFRVVAGIKEEDHRVIEIEQGEEVSEAVLEWMAVDGYEFAVSPKVPKGSKRKVYFTRRHAPALRM